VPTIDYRPPRDGGVIELGEQQPVDLLDKSR
jgi:hypothetical protein